jgi:hypothetical protein
MPKIVSLAERKRERVSRNVQIIRKIVDGEVVECINIDALPPPLLPYFLAIEPEQKDAPQP